VRNTLRSDSIHWHGIILPADMDGVPGLSFMGIAPGATFTYRFKVNQSGTYWYHSHSRFQEQIGLYGPIVVEPRRRAPRAEREHVVLLSDWTDHDPEHIYATLKRQSDYYNFGKRTAATFMRDARAQGLARRAAERRMWNAMRMDPTDLADVTGYAYTYLMNGATPAATGPAVRARRTRALALHQRLVDDVFRRAHSGPEADGGRRRRPGRRAGDGRRIPHRHRRGVRRHRQPGRSRLHDLRAGDGSLRLRARHARAARGMEADVPPLDARALLTMSDMMGSMDGGAMPGMDRMDP
jgi:FtsP/CotA-like multicopper oxidase with cupredoxin domain